MLCPKAKKGVLVDIPGYHGACNEAAVKLTAAAFGTQGRKFTEGARRVVGARFDLLSTSVQQQWKTQYPNKQERLVARTET